MDVADKNNNASSGQIQHVMLKKKSKNEWRKAVIIAMAPYFKLF